MGNIILEEIIDIRKVVSILNEELKSKKIFDMEYMLINNSIEDVLEVLKDNSQCYNLIKDAAYSNGATFEEILKLYFQYVKQKYDSLLIKDGKNDKIADKYYGKMKAPVKIIGRYVHDSKNKIGMNKEEVEKTLLLMKEAIVAYYKVYNNKRLIAELTTNRVDKSDYLEFSIKENQLLHLLGVTASQLRTNPDFIKLTGKKNMNSTEILEWIMRDLEGNNDLMQYSEDFIKRISQSSFGLLEDQFSNDTKLLLLNYHKVRAKSQTFLKYGPFEAVSLVAKLQNGKHLTVNSNSDTVMISRAECFKKYPWAYFGSVQKPDEKYIETLLIDSANGKKELLKGSSPAIVKGVYSLDSSGEEGGTNLFPFDEQFDLFCKAYDEFHDVMNFKNLKDYFMDLVALKQNEKSNVNDDVTRKTR